MDIKAGEFTLRLTHDELWDLVFDVERAMKHAMNTHWVHHQLQWKQNESKRIHRHKSMSFALGRPDLHDSLIKDCEEIITNFNKKDK